MLFVTGGGSWIGAATARLFTAGGGKVAVVDLDQQRADGVAADLDGSIGFAANVADEGSVEAAVAAAHEAFGGIDSVLNAAGHAEFGLLETWTLASWERMMAVHLRGAFLCCREAAPVMIRQRSGRIILLTSQLAYLGRPRYTAYSAAKGGLATFTRALAQELAPHGVLVNAVAPGLVDTGFDPLPEDAKRAHAAALPLGRLGTPDDLVGAFVFLASDESRYFCGQTLHPNGGEIMP